MDRRRTAVGTTAAHCDIQAASRLPLTLSDWRGGLVDVDEPKKRKRSRSSSLSKHGASY